MPVPKLGHSEDQISQNNKKCQSKLNDKFRLNIKTICPIQKTTLQNVTQSVTINCPKNVTPYYC
jgi:hypothetical protein